MTNFKYEMSITATDFKKVTDHGSGVFLIFLES